MNYEIRETGDFTKLSGLYYDSGLEVTPGQAPPENVIKHWECVDDKGALMAGATLRYKGALCVFEYLAVAETMRGMGLGKKLLDLAEKEAEAAGVDFLWLCAKVPEFYDKYDWERVDKDDAPDISICQSCGQYHISCFPCIMKKKLNVTG